MVEEHGGSSEGVAEVETDSQMDEAEAAVSDDTGGCLRLALVI